MLAICSLGYNTFGKGTYYPDVTDESLYWDYKPYEVVLENINFPNGYTAPYPRSLHAFVWGKWPNYPTYNDWTIVRSDTPDSTDDYSLTTNLNIVADTLNRNPVPAATDTSLCWLSPSKTAPGFGTIAGYQWSVPETGPGSDQVIIGCHISAVKLNYPCGDNQAAVLQMRDGEGNVLWSHNSLTTDLCGNEFLPNATSYWPDKTTKTIQIIMHVDPEYIDQPHWIWGGNSGYVGSISLFTVNEGPRCGDTEHPIPVGDFNGDCVVDANDLRDISVDWLECDDPTNPECCFVACPENSYYGFYATYLGATTGGNHIERVAAFSNVNHMFWNTEVADTFIANRSKLIIDTSWVFWNGNTGLNPSYQYQWDLIEESIKSYFSSRGMETEDIKDYIAAFAVEDEPYWRSNFTPTELETAVATIKTGFPDIQVMVIFAYPSVNDFTSSSDIPSNLDWIGFDQYGTFSTIPGLVTKIKTYKQPHQKIWLVPQGYAGYGGGDSDATVAGWSYDYHNLFLSDPEIIGQLVFLNRGAREYLYPSTGAMPLTYAVQEAIGRQILTGNCNSNTGYMQTDINRDHYINMHDLAKFANSWMIDNQP